MGNLNKFGVKSVALFSAIGIAHSHATNFLRLRLSSFFISVLLSLVTLIISLFVLPQITCAVDVTLVWDANSEPDIDGYKIFYRQEGDSYSYNHPDWVGSYTETSCTIYGLDDNTTYHFVARAVDVEGNESGDSNEVRYQPGLPPTADAGLDQTADAGDTVTLDGSNSFDPDEGTISSDSLQTIFDLRCVSRSRNTQLRWSSVAEATCYNVYRSLTSGGPYSMIADCHDWCTYPRCTYRDTNVVKGTEYYYVVTSVAEGVESLYSNESRSE